MSEFNSTAAASADEDPAAYWQPHIDAWRASGLSARRFCSRHSLPYGKFLYWYRKQCKPSTDQPMPSAFTRVVPVAEDAGASGLTVSLPGGVQIGGIDANNVALLPQILAKL